MTSQTALKTKIRKYLGRALLCFVTGLLIASMVNAPITAGVLTVGALLTGVALVVMHIYHKRTLKKARATQPNHHKKSIWKAASKITIPALLVGAMAVKANHRNKAKASSKNRQKLPFGIELNQKINSKSDHFNQNL